MKDREHQIQCACVQWFRMKYPKEIIFAIPNGGARYISTAVAMKNEGVMAGIPDLMVLAAKKGYNGLFVEMKKSSVGKSGKLINKGHLSDTQKELLPKIENKGYKVVVCYSFDDFEKEITDYLE